MTFAVARNNVFAIGKLALTSETHRDERHGIGPDYFL